MKRYKGREISRPESLLLDGVQGAGEQRSKPYMQYGARAAQPATPQSAKSTSGAAGSAGRQAGAAQDLWIHHFDFYRLNDPGIVADQLAESLENPSVINVVEWSDIVQNVLPEDRLSIEFKMTANNSDERRISISYPNSKTVLIRKLETNWQELRP